MQFGYKNSHDKKQKYDSKKNIFFSKEAKKSLELIEKFGFGNLPIIVAKTQYSLSDNKDLLNAPKDFEITVKEVRINRGAGFITVLLGNILTMPGLSKKPNLENIDIDELGKIKGLF